jgi:ABC-type oligopeptide transport system substrate-binding subunit
LIKQHSELPFKGERMKKLFTIACTLVLGSALSFAQAAQTPPAGGTTGTGTTKSETKTKKHSHGKKGTAFNPLEQNRPCRASAALAQQDPSGKGR